MAKLQKCLMGLKLRFLTLTLSACVEIPLVAEFMRWRIQTRKTARHSEALSQGSVQRLVSGNNSDDGFLPTTR